MPRNGHKLTRPVKDQLPAQLDIQPAPADWTLEDLQIQQEALENALRRFKTLYENSPVGFITFDHAGRIIDVNKAAAKLLHIAPATMLGLSMTALVSGRFCNRFMEHLRKCRSASGEAASVEIEII